MTPDEILKSMREAPGIPEDALREAVAKAGELAPAVYALADKLCRGVYLMPGEAQALMHGLDALAAARHPELCERLLALMRQPLDALDQVFPAHAELSFCRLLISVWDRDAAELRRLIEHADLDAEVRAALYSMMVRLTFDGRIPREETAAFLGHLAQDGCIDDEDPVWFSWEHAVVCLGLAELEPLLRQAWEKPVYSHHTEVDHTEAIEALQHAAANPGDVENLGPIEIGPIDDPVEAAAWIGQRAKLLEQFRAQHLEGEGETSEPDEDPDDARSVRLKDEELAWLEGFLESRQVPPMTMSLEMLDGFLTALLIGPTFVPLSEYLPEIWGAGEGEAVTWAADQEQATYVIGLIVRHCNAIAARRMADAPHRPCIAHFGMLLPGEAWAEGFAYAFEWRQQEWEPITYDQRGEKACAQVFALLGDEDGSTDEPLSSELRQKAIDALPQTIRRIAAFWRTYKAPERPLAPLRSAKVGRNEPCPCGSGKKYKKCCGSGAGPTVH